MKQTRCSEFNLTFDLTALSTLYIISVYHYVNMDRITFRDQTYEIGLFMDGVRFICH